MRFLMLLFVIVPIIEITVLINVGDAIGAWNTVGLVILSAFVGVNMLRYQGMSTLATARSRLQKNELPAQEMMEGLVLAVGGALLITPGFVTDVMGFCCLLPFTRRLFVSAIKGRVVMKAASHQFNGNVYEAESFRSNGSTRPDRSNQGEVIDVEYIDHDKDKNAK